MLQIGRSRRALIVVVAALVLASSAWTVVGAGKKVRTTPGVVPPNANHRGTSYAEWSAAWSRWALEYPVDGHPFVDGDFDVSARQSGKVWFLGAPFGEGVEREITIPTGTSLFFVLLGSEASSLEDPPFFGETEAEQADAAAFITDHVVPESLFATIDGKSVKDLEAYRFASPQYGFDAPSPWINGEFGGEGTSVADGYYLMLSPLSKGEHTLHYGGVFHFDAGELGPDAFELEIDITYHITVK